jgi:hypothetical protein
LFADGIGGATLDRTGPTWQVIYVTSRTELSLTTLPRFRALPGELSAQVFGGDPVEVRIQKAGAPPKVIESFSTNDGGKGR